jgi:hypothetical protein
VSFEGENYFEKIFWKTISRHACLWKEKIGKNKRDQLF